MTALNTLSISHQKLQDLSKDELKELEALDKHHENIIGNLSLFSTKEAISEDTNEFDSIILKRPVTPLQDDVSVAPDSLQKLQEFIRRRIQPQTRVLLTNENQLEIAGVIMGEVSGCWRDMKQQIDYPFFTEKENKELNRRIALHVITACIELFRHYCDKAETLSKKQIFSHDANMSRLKVQLSLDARKFLDVLTIRRYVTERLKTESKLSAEESQNVQDNAIYPNLKEDLEEDDKNIQGKKKDNSLTFQNLLMKSTPVKEDNRPRYKSSRELVYELRASLPSLNIMALYPIVKDLRFFRHDSPRSHRELTSLNSTTTAYSIRPDSTDLLKHEAIESRIEERCMKRSYSLPEFRGDQLLAHEIDLDLNVLKKKYKDVDERNLTFQTSEADQDRKVSFSHLSSSLIKSDLKKLGRPLDSYDKTNMGNDEEDLPPLIQASGVLRKEENRLLKLKQKIAELDKKARKALAEETFEPSEPTHPQPTVITRVVNQSSIRTSDVRPPPRQCLSRITQNIYDPLWNDITGDIDDDTVKELDRNLFKGEEIREVYREILKTVDQSHRSFTSDPIIEPCAEELSLTAMLASSSLYKHKKERIINPRLSKVANPPWPQGTSPKEWAKPKVFTPGDKKGIVNLSSVVDNIVAKEVTIETDELRQKAAARQETAPRPASRAPNSKYTLSTEEFDKNVREMPKAVQERLLRSYQAWLATWKADVDSEDYTKYLATQETDFLGLVFHLYDSEDDEDDVIVQRKRQEDERRRKEKERKKKLQQLVDEKTEFTPGFWNARSVLMGGLGKDPDLPEASQDEIQTAEVSPGDSKKPLSQDIPLIVYKTRYTEGNAPLQRQTTKMTEKTSTPELKPAFQDRLDALWTRLRFPENQRLDMAIKYGSSSDLEDILDYWERAAEAVLERENIIGELEKFERQASDPNRFFSKGHRGSSQARLEEGRIRDELYARLEKVDEIVRKEILSLEAEYEDTLTYMGRPYLDKMKWDKVEMLYWLQEERRLSHTKTHSDSGNRSRSPAVLPPL